MSSQNFEQLENTLRTLGKRADLSYSKKQAIRDKVFRAIGQVELADAIVEGESKAKALFVSIKSLQKALLPHRLSFSMPVTVITTLVVFLGSLVTGVAAQGAGPSDALFWAKKVLERVELAFATDPVSKAQVTINIASERLKYLETSVGEEQALGKVLRESQVALVNAKQAIKKAQEGGEDTVGLEGLVGKFGALLDDQKTLLADIEKTAKGDEIKKTVVAIRDVLKEEKETPAATATTPSKPAATVAVQPPVEEALPTGQATVTGRFGTSGGVPVLVIGSKVYRITTAPTNLSLLIGATARVVGEFGSEEVRITEISANGIVYGSKN